MPVIATNFVTGQQIQPKASWDCDWMANNHASYNKQCFFFSNMESWWKIVAFFNNKKNINIIIILQSFR